jgi:hypothetical protein
MQHPRDVFLAPGLSKHHRSCCAQAAGWSPLERSLHTLPAGEALENSGTSDLATLRFSRLFIFVSSSGICYLDSCR